MLLVKKVSLEPCNAIITKLEIIFLHATLWFYTRFVDDLPLGGAIIEVEVFGPFTQ